MSYICEVKKASPSKGLIAPDFPYLEIAKEYKSAGASAISCLTEPFYFQGSDQYLWEIASEVDIPVLRKDFVIDDYMILQAAAYGAAAVLDVYKRQRLGAGACTGREEPLSCDWETGRSD